MNTARTRIARRRAMHQLGRMTVAIQTADQPLHLSAPGPSSIIRSDNNLSLQGLTAFAGFVEKVEQLYSKQRSSYTPAAH